MRVFYLHGFASSRQSTKAAYFAEHLRPHGVELECPDFNEPDFQTLTMTRMLEQLGAALATAPEPASLIGSSLGGALAVLAAHQFAARINRLVLLAPAVMFAKPGHHLLPPARIDEWREAGSIPFFHYGFGEERRLDWEFYLDTLRYDPFETMFSQPTLVFQGLRDTSVDPPMVEAFARRRSNITLSLLDDDHQLTASLPRMWTEIERFLGLRP